MDTHFQEELHHFEHKLKKHGYFKSEAELSEKILMESAHKNNFASSEKKEKLDSKVSDYARKVCHSLFIRNTKCYKNTV